MCTNSTGGWAGARGVRESWGNGGVFFVRPCGLQHPCTGIYIYKEIVFFVSYLATLVCTPAVLKLGVGLLAREALAVRYRGGRGARVNLAKGIRRKKSVT